MPKNVDDDRNEAIEDEDEDDVVIRLPDDACKGAPTPGPVGWHEMYNPSLVLLALGPSALKNKALLLSPVNVMVYGCNKVANVANVSWGKGMPDTRSNTIHTSDKDWLVYM